LGIDICYSDTAVVEESIPLQLRDLNGYNVNIRRRGSWGSTVHGFDARIQLVNNEHMTVNLLDDMGEPMHEAIAVKLDDILKIEVL
jgi:hypothetical protein